MSPNPRQRASSRQQAKTRQQARTQGGWLMPVAAFIIVAMGLLAAGMARLGSQTSIAAAQETVSLQTFHAAETGAQYAMNRLFYSTAIQVTRTSAGNACTAVDGDVLNLNTAGMQNCQVNIGCVETVDTGNTTSFFQIDSVASCDATLIWATRTVRVSAYLQ